MTLSLSEWVSEWHFIDFRALQRCRRHLWKRQRPSIIDRSINQFLQSLWSLRHFRGHISNSHIWKNGRIQTFFPGLHFFVVWIRSFLAVQDSSIGDSVTDWVMHKSQNEKGLQKDSLTKNCLPIVTVCFVLAKRLLQSGKCFCLPCVKCVQTILGFGLQCTAVLWKFVFLLYCIPPTCVSCVALCL